MKDSAESELRRCWGRVFQTDGAEWKKERSPKDFADTGGTLSFLPSEEERSGLAGVYKVIRSVR